MDQQRSEGAVSDDWGKAGDALGDLSARAEKTVQDKIDQSKPILRDLQDRASATIDKTADLARNVSSAGVQAVNAVQGAARDVGNQASHAAAAVYEQGARVYEQGARAGGSVTRYAAEQPFTALLIAGAIGYGLARLIHRT